MLRPIFISLCLFLSGFASLLPAQEPATAKAPQILLVKVEGAIGGTTVAMVSRALAEARSRGISTLMLEIKTNGGQLEDMNELQTMLSNIDARPVRTVAYVNGKAYSAGAMIALACDEIFMRPGSEIGAASPIQIGPSGISDIPDDYRRKVISAQRAVARGILEQRQVSKSLITMAEAMVDVDMKVFEVTYVDAADLQMREVVDASRLQEIKDLPGYRVVGQPRSFDSPLTLTTQEAVDLKLARGSYVNVEELVREEYQLSMQDVGYMEETWSIRLAAFLDSMKSVLFVLGFIFLLIELKTPGFALPGILGIILIGLALFSSYVMGLAAWQEILLFFLGIGLIGAEIFLFPGTLVAGLLGFICLVTGLILSQQTFIIPHSETQSSILQDNLVNLGIMLVSTLVLVVLFYHYMEKIPFFRRAVQAPPKQVSTGAATMFETAQVQRSDLLDLQGEAATDLRPAGILEVGDQRYDVVTEGDFVQRGTRIRIIHVSGNRIVVEPISGNSQGGEVALGTLALLVIVGLVLIIAEVFFVSMGILGGIATVALLAAVFLAFTKSTTLGFVFLAVVAIAVPLTIFYAFRWLPLTPFGKKLFLGGPKHDEVQGGAQEEGLDGLLHQTGVTTSALRPSGYARIGHRRIDVITRGEMLEEDTPVRVIDVEMNRVVVKEVTNAAQ